jgi:hypothetical protein
LTENDFSWSDDALLADFGPAAGQPARDTRRVTFLPQPVRTCLTKSSRNPGAPPAKSSSPAPQSKILGWEQSVCLASSPEGQEWLKVVEIMSKL